MPFSIPDKILDSILQSGPWAALFLLAVILSGLVLKVFYKAMREADKRSVDMQKSCDLEVKRINEDRRVELIKVLESEAAFVQVMKELSRTVEARSGTQSQMAESLIKMGAVMEANQNSMIATGVRLERLLINSSHRLTDVWNVVVRRPGESPQPPPVASLDD